MERLLGYYLTAAETACDVLYPGRRHRPTGVERSAADLPDLGDAERARTWFTREQDALLAAVALAERRGLDRYVVCLSRNLAFQLNARGNLEEYRATGRASVAAAKRLGDLALLGMSLSNLGVACWRLGRFEEGLEAAREGRDVAARTGDRHTEAHSEGTLGQFNSLLGNFPEALTHLRRAIAFERELGAPRAEADNLTLLSTLYEQWGRYEEAEAAALRAIDLQAGLGRFENQFTAFTDLAFAYAGLGRWEDAALGLDRARARLGQGADPGNTAVTLALSADVDQHLGRPTRVPDPAEQALELVSSYSSPLRRAKVENIVGRLRGRQGEYEAARELHASALESAASMRYRIEEAYALSGLADAADGDTDAARHRAAAEKLFERMGVARDRRRR